MAKRGPKPTVTFEGRVYSCRSYKVDVPDLGAMSRTGALMWLHRNTTPRGYSRNTNPLAGLGGAIRVDTA